MKLIIIDKRSIKIFVSALLIIILSAIYTLGFNRGIISAFVNNEKMIPIYCVDTEEKKIAISFDAAWGSDKTEDILSILKEHNVKTTFFLVAFWVDKYPDMVKRIDEEGHEIGNHSATHPNMSKLSEEKIREELTITSNKIEAITGKKVTLFRPPFGDYNNRVIRVSKELGYYVIQWDVDSLDYKDYGAEAIVDRVISKVKNGSIVLFHNNATYITEALPVILDRLQEMGYEVVPISELIYKDNYYIDHTGKQIKHK
ncbi:polysaccharide deacetylase family sporulation protein PdaB [Lutispora thermophila]|uniref:Polysaccharide deacetylase family sporulation protein PdaB/delta-lactam-biosynthetic de-N-acetylase,TIGR02884 n=1 Tax=Lutispora thermophila DSM 19022 TaxID=1122184 RepID=A0A1M6GLZ5_9FIRM|nr:polysaccharide deacetylase family sporulation protein PdaB [Lutispora thermophila]SHJ10953.1 polysaccharide deacetylase family sporulation protein PdaB/delta-lactam-biosynthetic de-N-acetylase,TIGR02884 [Lutispora thermophila DSM 19022]